MLKIALFMVVGVIAFLFEYATIAIGVSYLGIGPIYPRILSLPAAITMTWLLNRRFVFNSEKAPTFLEYFVYSSGMLAGASVNFGCYTLIALTSDFMYQHPFLNLVISTAVSAMFNYCFANFIVFR